MGRSRYLITEADKPHFMTCTVVEWLAVFTRPETVQIVLDSWHYQRQHTGLKLYGYVILENHLHFLSQQPPGLAASAGDILPFQEDTAFVQGIQLNHQPPQGRLPGPGFPHQAEVLPGFYT